MVPLLLVCTFFIIFYKLSPNEYYRFVSPCFIDDFKTFTEIFHCISILPYSVKKFSYKYFSEVTVFCITFSFCSSYVQTCILYQSCRICSYHFSGLSTILQSLSLSISTINIKGRIIFIYNETSLFFSPFYSLCQIIKYSHLHTEKSRQ